MRHGTYADLPDFTRRIHLGVEQARLLIRAGAFRFTGRSKKDLLWEVHSLLRPKENKSQHEMLFVPETRQWKLPPLHHSRLEQAFDEIELLGFPLCPPFELLKEQPQETLRAAELPAQLGREVSIAAQLIVVKTTFTHKGERMAFGTFLDMDGEWLDTVHFPPAYKAHPFRGIGCYLIRGKVIVEHGAYSIDVSFIQRLETIDREKHEEKKLKSIEENKNTT